MTTPASEPDQIVERLSALAAGPGPVSRETAQGARELWIGLAETCRGRAELRDAYKRGAEAWTRIRDGYAAGKANHPGEAPQAGSRAPQADSVPQAGVLPPAGPDASPEERDENGQQKRRMIAALRQAAGALDPSRFVEHVRLCERAWIEIGPAGSDEAALHQDYRDAVAAFWRVVDARSDGGGGR